jgi:alkaline phosphatase
MNSLPIHRRALLKSAGLGAAASALGVSGGRAAEKKADKVRGIVFMVSDGMSPGVLTLAQAYARLTHQRGTHWWELNDSKQAARGLMDTASANSMVTDSAAASSAWGGGQRVNNGAINVSPSGGEIEPIAAILKRRTKANIGLVTTATVTHATPAGFAASVKARSSEPDIALQYLGRADVILGGGSGFFDAGQRPDKRDLRGDFAKAGYDHVSTRDDMLAAKKPRLLGTFTRGHLPFSIDRDNDPALAAAIPTLAEMSRVALARFLADQRPFLLQIEGARIDHAAHLNDIGGLLGDQLAFDDALGAVLALTASHPDVLVVVTSDHGNANPGLNGMGNGYCESSQCFARIARCKGSHERIFNDWKASRKPVAATITGLVRQHLDFALREDEAEALTAILRKREVIEWNHQLDKPEGLIGQIAGNHTGIGWTGTTHTSDPTLITAFGPQAERFSGMVTNSDIFGHFVETLG